jgi:hypothetical protein
MRLAMATERNVVGKGVDALFSMNRYMLDPWYNNL